MKLTITTAVAFILFSGADQALAQDLPPASKENFHIYLLAGQSNMAGRGVVETQDKLAHPRVFALSKDGAWRPAVAPIHYDKPVAGVGLGRSFAIALAERDEDIAIGLVPAACGGSPISAWRPGGYHTQTKSHPYDDAIRRARRAMQDGVLKGVLWHQGESDSKPELAGAYPGELAALIARFRKDLNAPDLPFVIGQLGRFPGKPWTRDRQRVNAAHVSIADSSPSIGFVSSTGLTPKSDNVHFDSRSLREFGKRYANAYLKLTRRNKD
ncbi:MAG: sialate O-acetylesterase [Planctomycetota bacterium]|jgi:hypothetical protein